ncbi:fork head domain-containing protein [Auriculariales sp. MPI-PUGE-AT-0066]|nr:fork head domain-containing protein [Auriculariales sp. MPI-PUGE-AT-0066]
MNSHATPQSSTSHDLHEDAMDPADIDTRPFDPDAEPLNLEALEDNPPGSKPPYPYSTLIRCAIKGSPHSRLVLEDIYAALEGRFPYFSTCTSGWKNSIRHNLSLNPCFVKVARADSERGKGSYWTVDESVDPRSGVHRARRRASKAKRQPTAPSSSVQGPSDQFCVELDENGEFIWRNVWYNELIRLRQWTADQDKVGVGDDWYRVIFYRVRSALQHIVPPTDPLTGQPLVPIMTAPEPQHNPDESAEA